MNTYILMWDPRCLPWSDEDLDKYVKATTEGKKVRITCPCGDEGAISPGDRIFLVRRKKPKRGMIGAGRVATRPHRPKNNKTRGTSKSPLFVGVDFEDFLAIQNIIPTAKAVRAGGLDFHGMPMYAYEVVEADQVKDLECLWAKHLENIGGNHARQLRKIATLLENEGYFESQNLEDERNKRLQEIVKRSGQPKFRTKLLTAYGGRCAITGCDAEAALEAAHIVPFLGPKTDNVSNGLLLRADIHTLFDRDMIGIDPNSLKLVISKSLRGTSYDNLDGTLLTTPDNAHLHPSQTAFQQRWKSFAKRI